MPHAPMPGGAARIRMPVLVFSVACPTPAGARPHGGASVEWDQALTAPMMMRRSTRMTSSSGWRGSEPLHASTT